MQTDEVLDECEAETSTPHTLGLAVPQLTVSTGDTQETGNRNEE